MPAPFRVSETRTAEVPTMQQRIVVPYTADEDLTTVALPVRGGMFSMVLIVPDEEQSLSSLRTRLTGRSFGQLVKRMTARHVELHLPRFGVASHVELGDALAKMGMRQAFSVIDADLSGVNGERNLCLDKVFHEAIVDVDEEGVEAVAATAAVMRLKSLRPGGTVVRFNRPFLFALYQNQTGSILFLGQFVDPDSQVDTET